MYHSDAIEREIDYMERRRADAATRLVGASDAGSKLATAVYAFTEDPEGVGTDALATARKEFMCAQAGGFYVASPSP